jgi:DNA gyrase/topoisomerase IV subunit A|tara:strand:- start:2705 stop:3076 length:372 start_codon:yes stop_codon:yes gene_type:complete
MVLNYLLKHWKELLIATLFLVLWTKSRLDYGALKELEQQRIESHEESMKELKNNYEIRIKDQKETYEKYKKEIDVILEHYGSRVTDLEIKTSERKDEYQSILKEKPETLIKEIEQKFGFKYVE